MNGPGKEYESVNVDQQGAYPVDGEKSPQIRAVRAALIFAQ